MNEIHQSIHKTLDQIRAAKAWEFVKNAKKRLTKNEKDKNEKFEKYVSLVKKFPAIINNNGLGQALAFIFSKAKKENPEGILFEQLQKWLTENENTPSESLYHPPYPGKNKDINSNDYLLQCIMNNNSMMYLQATHESMSILDKMRNFASGLSNDSNKED